MGRKISLFLFCFFLIVSSDIRSQITDSTRIWKKSLKKEMPVNDRVRYYNKIAACYWYVYPDSALWFGRQGQRLIDGSVTPLVRGYNDFVLGVAWQNIGLSDSSFHYLMSAVRVFTSDNLEKQKFRAVEQLAENYRIIGKPDSAIALVTRSLAWFREKDKKPYIASSLIILGNITVEQNRNQQALVYFLESAAIAESLTDTAMIGITQVGIGNIYLNLGNLYKSINPIKSHNYFLSSISYFEHSLDLYERMGHNTGVCFSKMNLLSAMVALKKYSRADSVLKGCKSCLENSNSRVRMSLNFIEAHIAWAKKDYSKAKSILEKIVHDTTGSGLLPILNDAKLMLANISWQSGVHHEALRLGREVYSMSRSTGSFNAGYESAKFLSACYRETGPCDSSLLYASSAGIFQDSLFTAAGHENMDELEMRYKSQLLGQQLTILKGQEDLNDRRTIIIVITAIFLLVVLLLLIILLWLRQKRLHSEKLVAAGVQALAEKEILLQRSRVEQISLERQLQDQEISRLNVNLGLKEQDLVLQSLLKANTLNLIKSLMDRLAPFSFRLTRKMDQEEFNLMLLQLNKEIDFSPLDDFEKLFKELHPGFYGNLCAAVPDLSQNDLIICAMLRLNLSSKDISRIANISVSTVESGRSRIRKKLGIDSGSGLVSTLMKF